MRTETFDNVTLYCGDNKDILPIAASAMGGGGHV